MAHRYTEAGQSRQKNTSDHIHFELHVTHFLALLFASNNIFNVCFRCLDVFPLSAYDILRMNNDVHNVVQTQTDKEYLLWSCEFLVQGWYIFIFIYHISLKARKNLTEGKIKSLLPAIPMINTTAIIARAIIKLKHLMELALSLRNIIGPPEYPTFTGNTGPNGPCITGISIRCLGFTLPSSSVAETLSPTPHLLHQPPTEWSEWWLLCVCGWHRHRGPVFHPLGRIALQLWASPFTTVTFAFCPQWALYPRACWRQRVVAYRLQPTEEL